MRAVLSLLQMIQNSSEQITVLYALCMHMYVIYVMCLYIIYIYNAYIYFPFCFYIIYSVWIHTYEFYTDYTYAYICTYQMHFLFCLLIWLRHVFVIYRIASHLKEVLEKYDFFLPVNKVVNPLDVELLRTVLRTIKCKKNVPRFATSHDLMCLIWFFSYAAFSHRSIGCTRLKNAQSNSWNHVARNWE